MSLLLVNDLNVRFRTDDAEVHAVRDVSFRLEEREALAIVGESGSGKSQTVNAILGLLAENGRASGNVRLNGKNILNLPEAEMRAVRGRQLSVVFQNPMTSLNPYRTIGFQLTRVLIEQRGLTRDVAEAEVIRMLEAVRLPAARSRLKSYPHEYSGGMRQRVMIAAALLCRPDILIADEPTTALDVTVQASILQLLRELRESFRTSLILVSHDLGVVAGHCERVLVMDQGRVVEQNATDGLFAVPEHPVTRKLLEAVPRLDRPVSPVPGPRVDESPVLAAERLTVRYPMPRRDRWRRRYFSAVRGIDLALRPGESVGLVGESGCGKSSVARALLGLGEYSGTVRFAGQDVDKFRQRDVQAFRRNVQLVFQDPVGSLDPRMTAAESIAEPLWANGLVSKAEVMPRVIAMLERVGLDADMINRYPHECSGGQCQRIGIARALVAEPQVLVCDEAVSALDVSVQAEILALLKVLQRELQLALLFITHDLAVVRDLCARVVVMYAGRIVEQGPVAQVFETPRHPYTRALIDAAPVPDPAVERRRSRAPLAFDLPAPWLALGGCAFSERCEFSDGQCERERPVLDGRSHAVACHHEAAIVAPPLAD